MPLKIRRNLAVVSTCIRCGQDFYPFRGREDTQQYCSRTCSRAAGLAKVADLRVSGGQSNRAEEHSGVKESPIPPSPRPPSAPHPSHASQPPQAQPAVSTPLVFFGSSSAHLIQHAAEYCVAHEGNDWRDSGERYERLTARLCERERGGERTLIVAGYGAGLHIERDALIVTEGHTHHPQTPVVHTLYRGVHGVARIVCLNPQGNCSFPAVHWCAQQDITIVLLDRSGHLLSTLTPDATADARLRRCQYLAQAAGTDVPICQELLRRKLTAQRATLVSHPDLPGQVHALDVLDTALAWLTLPELPPWLMAVDMVRTYEARTARAYFTAWDGWALRWDKVSAKRLPPHWKVARERSSPLAPNNNARHAVDPLNAIQNYAYALLEGQCRQALTRLGFDVACGFLHLDKSGRDSLVYDLMECDRGTVDGLVLDFLKHTTLHYGDVILSADGSCRLHPQLARAAVAGCRVPQDRVDEHARWLRDAVLKLSVQPVQIVSVPPVSDVFGVQAVAYRGAGTTKRRPRTRQTVRFGPYRTV
jgi:CRISPR-associated endonuclease Cas1